MNQIVLFSFVTFFVSTTMALDRRPTISFITQPETVTDIGGTVEMLCSVQYAQDYPVIWMKLDPVDRNNDLVSPTTTYSLFQRYNLGREPIFLPLAKSFDKNN